ncbi:hypothetical protein N9A28_06985 [Sulfurimonas sp.]|nr:hypothetical protein [Sulfurimonas sp.]
MTYISWFNEHALKHKTIVDKLLKNGLSKEAIVDYFDFDNMVKEEKDFCLLYQDNKKCHDMDSLNCYLCACPHFRFNDTGRVEGSKIKFSHCSIDSKYGSFFENDNKLHQDCTKCEIPHKKSYILKHFDYDFKKIMKDCSSF